jgi:putative hydroxymethylpyrimidine transport system permease protein
VSAALIVLAALGGWEALVRAGLVDELILPAPTQVAEALWTDRDLLAPDLAVTTWEVVLGLAAATRWVSPCTSPPPPPAPCGRW